MPTTTARPPAPPDTDPQLSTLMTHPLIGITPDSRIDVAWKQMTRHEVRHLPVMTDGGCSGLVLESDVVRCIAERSLLGDHSRPATAGELCRVVPTLRLTDRRSTAAQQMHADGIDAVLVTDGPRVLGIVTAVDLIRSLALTGTS
ncbi:HPP family protein [Pseudonocardia sp. GCM10023141]|uniref:CBS domain-containing protein n=1 Tax=Pseudonocardia sp. GCM10023141 TaxID=3252653 RepID=UPI00360BEFEF